MKYFRTTVIVLIAGCLGVWAFQQREPQFQGRTLMEWTDAAQIAYDHCENSFYPEGNVDWQKCRDALNAMQGDAMPLLLKWIQVEDSAAKMKAIRLLRNKRWAERLKLTPDPAVRKHIAAVCGFSLLRRNASPVFPALVEMTKSKDQDRRMWGFYGLGAARAEKEIFIPVAIRLLREGDASLQDSVATVFFSLYPDEAKSAGVCEKFPGACETVEAVVK